MANVMGISHTLHDVQKAHEQCKLDLKPSESHIPGFPHILVLGSLSLLLSSLPAHRLVSPVYTTNLTHRSLFCTDSSISHT